MLHKDLLANISPEKIHSFLLRNGWRKLDSERQEVCNYQIDSFGPERREIRICTPGRHDLSDYDSFVFRTISVLCRILGYEAFDLVQQILNPCDIFKARVISPSSSNGTYPIDRSVKLFESLRDLFIFSACAEIKNEKFCKRRLDHAVDLAKTFHVGPNSVGSMIVSFYVILPVAPSPEMRNTTPEARKVMKRVVNGFRIASRAVETGDFQEISRNFQQGFNANMCDAVAELLEGEDECTCKFSVQFDPEWEIVGPREETFEIASSVRTFVKRASMELRNIELVRRAKIQGYFYELRRENVHDTEQGDRQVKVMGNDEEGNFVRAYVYLNEQDYQRACDAHKMNAKVTIEGNLTKEGRKNILYGPTIISVGEAEE